MFLAGSLSLIASLRAVAGFRVISAVAGHFAAGYFVSVPLFNIISVVNHFASRCCLVESFPRLIATLQDVLSALLINMLLSEGWG